MDEKSDEILDHIESQRNQLSRNLNELESKVRRTADWRAHYQENPLLMLGAAMGGGLLLGALVGGGRKAAHPASRDWSSAGRYATQGTAAQRSMPGPATQQARQHAAETVDKIKAALIAFGIAKGKEFLAQAIPGLDRHLGEPRSSQPASSRSFSGQSEQSSGSPSSYGQSSSQRPSMNANPMPNAGMGI